VAPPDFRVCELLAGGEVFAAVSRVTNNYQTVAGHIGQ
jgi:hypothetical protein